MKTGFRQSWLTVAAVLLLLGTATFLFYVGRDPDPFAGLDTPSDHAVRAAAEKFAAFEARERSVAETVWAKELLAQECARTIEALWDAINAATNKLSVLASFPVGEVLLPAWQPPRPLAHGIHLHEPAGSAAALSAAQWRAFVEDIARSGWQLAQVEFRHVRFDLDPAGQPRQSTFYFSAHLNAPARMERAILEGDLIVDWASQSPEDELRPVKRVDASRLLLKTRQGEPPFRLVLQEQFTLPQKSRLVDALLVYDLDGDGPAEIVLPLRNRLYRRGGDGRYTAEPLCPMVAGEMSIGLIADFDGDGAADLLGEGRSGLVLFPGSSDGRFDQPGRPAWTPETPLRNPMALTCGDIDRDGDLDVFLGQYRNPDLGQVLRPAYYDANDGYPSFLLRNDGTGHFVDATAAAGLEAKRWRRIFSASWVDLDDDADPDLLVVSDFAGVDLYRNDGHGRFTDVTAPWVAEPWAFGMAHALADFNADGFLDFLMIGMNSPTVDRLEHLGLHRPQSGHDPAMRRRMTYGNRLYLGHAGGGFAPAPANTHLARTGWSWGCSAADFDNDGFPDLYIANGYETQRTVRDYESEFWLHDLYVDDGVEDVTATMYFDAKFARTRGRGWSYGGYEKNRLFLNQEGRDFLEAAHLFDVALEADSRSVVTDDLDGDGWMDLLVTTSEVWPIAKQTLRVYKNALGDASPEVRSDQRRLTALSPSPNPAPAGRGGDGQSLDQQALHVVDELPRNGSTHAPARGRPRPQQLLQATGALSSQPLPPIEAAAGGDARAPGVAQDHSWSQSPRVAAPPPNHPEMTQPANWIGFRFHEERGRPSPVGVQVKLRAGTHHTVRHLVTGDSFRAQHANTVHFGLGERWRVDSVEIRWPDRRTQLLRDPALNRYHSIRAAEVPLDEQ
ncbi:MAG: CRTAC1 family protein [Verrucomicrobiales bacterium]|nr:CRTAC1 family protein [Verrucomicrobiales bacterium]